MKTIYHLFLVVACLAAMAATSCSKNTTENSDDGGNVTPNYPSKPEEPNNRETRKISKVTSENDGYYRSYTLDYDDKGRVTTIYCDYMYGLENNPNITEEELWSAWGTLKCRVEYYGCGGPGSCAENETWKIATWSGPHSSFDDKYYSDGAFYACVRNDAEEYTDDPHYYCADWRDGECYFRF